MVILTPVMEVPYPDEHTPPWPVASRPAWKHMPLGPGSDALDAGLFLAVATCDSEGDDPLAALTAESPEEMLVVGGLRAHDPATGAEVLPGCCCELTDWREWYAMLDGRSPWLGHTPDPAAEFTGDRIRLHQDGHQPPTVEFGRDELPAMLDHARDQLAGFLDAVTASFPQPNLGHFLDRALRVSDLGAG